jgi:hypothetical protein
MAKMFYSASEAAEKLGRTEDELKSLVREGKLREFRDAGTVNYKVDDVDSLVPEPALDGSAANSAMGSALGGSSLSSSASGDILLEPIDDSSIEFAPGGSDIIALDESDLGGTGSGSVTGTGTAASQQSKGDTVVPSVGVNVFDDDDLDEQVDPLAQTAVTDVAGLGMEGIGSGSGILDLTNESDDTSLGKDLIDEIYTADEPVKHGSSLGMGEDTRAGIDDTLPEEGALDDEAEAALSGAGAAVKAHPKTVGREVREVIVYGPDPASSALTALLVVALGVMLVGGLGAASLVRGITPSLLEALYPKLWMFSAGSLVVAIIAGAITFFVAKKRSG